MAKVRQRMKDEAGKVYLVGAGPGDPGLLTVKGKACIKAADVLVYDYLAAESLLSYARKDAEKIYVGKKGGDHTLPQKEINRLLVRKAEKGLIVTRLKGGDPFIFGRGGEEVEVLVEAGIPFEVVPGVTSAVAAPAYAGIPLTHRKYTSTLAFVTGHEDPEKSGSNVNWQALATGIGTLVFFMGVKNLRHIVTQLVENGMAKDTPIALVRWGTTPRQMTLTGTLDTIVDKVAAAAMKAPAIIVVGQVVALRETMKWFENRPLMGKRIVVTRSREQASDLVKRLSDAGADCLECPTIQIEPAKDPTALDEAIGRLADYTWLVFTSVNGVDFFFSRLFHLGKDARALGHVSIAAIGPATAQRLKNFGLSCDIVPASFRAESVVEAFKNLNIKDTKILLPRAETARPVLPVELTKMGARVDEVTAYVTRPSNQGRDDLLTALENRAIDCVTFTSSSTVTNFRRMIPDEKFLDLMQTVTIACIGPITAETAKSLGFQVHLVAETYTIPGLTEAITAYYTQNG
jgi:uroporphyrinogen III methyltransferase/synthase